MITDLNEILVEWSYRTSDGKPDVKNSAKLIILESVLNDFGWSREARAELLSTLMTEDDIVKNRKTGNVYTVKNVNKDKHQLVKKNASKDDIEKVKKAKEKGDEEKPKDSEWIYIGEGREKGSKYYISKGFWRGDKEQFTYKRYRHSFGKIVKENSEYSIVGQDHDCLKWRHRIPFSRLSDWSVVDPSENTNIAYVMITVCDKD